MLKFFQVAFLFINTMLILGCGGSSGPTAVESNDIDQYLKENPEANVSMDEMYGTNKVSE